WVRSGSARILASAVRLVQTQRTPSRREKPSALLVEQPIEFPLLIVVQDSQDSRFSIAQHIPVVHSEIVEDDRHFLGLFGGKAEIFLPALEPDLLAALGVERDRAMHPFMGAQIHGYRSRDRAGK